MPDESVFVFDACAFIALLEDEPGADVVEALLQETANRCMIHAINACEIYYDLHRGGNEEDAEALEEVFANSGLELVETFSSPLWRAAGRIKAEWRRVSLADCIALALTMQTGGALVTSDHHELDRIAEAGLCPIQFIR